MANTNTKATREGNLIIAKKMRDYNNDPFFQKKLKEAREFLQKHPLPSGSIQKKK